jgi:hypothetical protein
MHQNYLRHPSPKKNPAAGYPVSPQQLPPGKALSGIQSKEEMKSRGVFSSYKYPPKF